MFGGKSLFGSTATANPLQPAQPQQPQFTTQSVAQICADTSTLLKSLCGPELCNDERDRVIARLNQIMVGLGVGSGYYANDKPAVPYNNKNMFYRFKGVVYNKLCHSKDEDGVCGLVLAVPHTQLADPAQQNNKDRVNTVVEGCRSVDATRTEVLIHVYEKGVGKVRATHLFKFLNQPDKFKLLEQELKCTKIVPLIELTREDRDKYLNTAPEGFEPQYWLQGVRSNPKSDAFLPAPIYGFEQLIERQKMQKVSDIALLTALEQVDVKKGQLEQSIGFYLSKLKTLRNAEKELSHRLLRVAVAIAKESRQGYGLTTKEDQLSAFAEQCNTMLFSPNALKDRVNAIFNLLQSDQDRIKEYFASVDLNLEQEDLSDLRFYLNTVQNKLEKAHHIQSKDLNALEVFENQRQ